MSNAQQQKQPKTCQNTKAIVENNQFDGKTSDIGKQFYPAPKVVKSTPKKPARAKASQSVENITTIADETVLDDTVNSGAHLTPSSKVEIVR